MIVTSTVGRIDAVIGRFEGPIMAYMEKEEGDFAANSLKAKLYNVKSSKHYSESVAGMLGVGDMVATDGAVPYDDLQEGYTKTFIHQVFKKGIEIKRETIDDALIIDMENQSSTLMDAANRTNEKFVHAPFNNASSTTFALAGKTFTAVGFDGLALGSTAHTSKSGKAANQSNYQSGYALTPANLKLVEEAMKAFLTDINERANIIPDTLFVPFELREEAWELTQSVGKVGTANNNKNPYEMKYNVIVSPWLTSATRWFVMDSKYMKRCLYWVNRKPLEINSQKDFNTQNWQIQAYERYSLGFTDWKWVHVCNT